MRRLPGQAARATGVLLHRLGTMAMVLAVLAMVGLAALSWRLSQGPLALPWLTQRIVTAVNAQSDAIGISIAQAALSWEGFHRGVDRPLDIRLTGVVLTDARNQQRVELPHVNVSISLRALLFGRVQPRAMEIDGARLLLQRTETGEFLLGAASGAAEAGAAEPGAAQPGALGALVAGLARPEDRNAGTSWFSQLRRVRIRNADLQLWDRRLQLTWNADATEIDLQRQRGGGVKGTGDLNLRLGGERARVQVAGELSAQDGVMRLHAGMSEISPALLARQAASLAPLAGLEARLGVSADVEFGRDQALRRISLDVHVAPGRLLVNNAAVLLDGAELHAGGTLEDIALDGFTLRLREQPGGPVTTLRAAGSIHRGGTRMRATLALDVDQVDFAGLARIWPPGIARPARTWITENIAAGWARDGHADFVVESGLDFDNPVLISSTGTMRGEDVTVYWLRPVPPIEQGSAVLTILDPDTWDIAVSAGRLAREDGRQEGGLQIHSGKLRIVGMSQHDQVGTIEAKVAGPVADALALLRHKRLHLLDRVALELNQPSGQLTGTLLVTVPFEEKLDIEQVPIQANVHLENVHLAGLVAGRTLNKGNGDLSVNMDGLKLTAQAEIADIPTRISAEMDFRAGLAQQVVRRIGLTGRADTQQLAAAGLDAGGMVSGTVGFRVAMTDRRDGGGDIQVNASLTEAMLTLSALTWSKPKGARADAEATLRMRKGRLTAIDAIAADGEALSLRGRAEFDDGKLSRLLIDRAVLGQTDLRGVVRMPSGQGPIRADITGGVIDLSDALARRPDPARRDDPPPGPPWSLDAKFDRAIMAGGSKVSGLTAHAENDGQVMRRLHVAATTGTGGGTGTGFTLDVTPVEDAARRAGRKLTASAENAGDLLRALDIARTIHGGRLSISAAYDDSRKERPLNGTAEISDFRVTSAPALGRLLQAMTLYGLVNVLEGPGLGFNRLIAPFQLAGDTLELHDARAFSASLGLTTKGRIDLAQNRLDLEGTIVPAYFFNTLLGNIPLFGRMFSPEEGGGLFAANYAIHGKLEDPAVTVNPLSMLTPGFLRGLFGIF